MSKDRNSTGDLRWLQIPGLVIAIIVSLFLALQFWSQTTNKVEELANSNVDNVIWTFTQLEVEFILLELAVSRIMEADKPDLTHIENVRKYFDIYYARVETLRESPFYSGALDRIESLEALHVLHRDNVELAKIVDGSDSLLIARAGEILERLEIRQALVRKVATRGNVLVADDGDRVRHEVRVIMQRLSAVSLFLLLCLALLVSMLYRLNKINRSRAMQRARENARYATVISTSPDALIVTNGQGRIVEFNQVAEDLLKVDRDQAMGRRFNRFLTNELDEVAALPLVEQGRVSGVELELTFGDKTRLSVEVSQGVAVVETQRYYVYFLRDISGRKSADSVLRASRDQALADDRAKSRFLAVMSHEMRTPLNGILGLVQLMRDGRQKPEDNARYLGMLESSGKVLLDHVNDVLDIAQLEAEGVQLTERPFDLDQLLASIVEPMQIASNRNHNRLIVETSPQILGWFTGDSMRLQQVVLNLIGNALKFTQDGEVTVSLSLFGTGSVVEMELQVADTGVGIAEDEQARIFEDFVRIDDLAATRSEGTGLGLGIAKRIITAMGGTIGVDSIQGEGSVFWIRIKLARSASVPDRAPQNLIPPAQLALPAETGRSVLIVEDNPTNRFVLREMLERDGHHVTEANDGSEGVAAALDTRFDLILMDINMPVMGGLEATRQIRRLGVSSQTRILALTAHVLDRDARLYSEAGIDGILSKPIKRQELRAVMRGQPVVQILTGSTDLILDENHLANVMSTLGIERGRDMLIRFSQDGPEILSMLGQSPVHLSDKLAVAIHNLAGISAMIGARKLRNTLNLFEKRLLTKDVSDISDWAEVFSEVWLKTVAKLVPHISTGK